MSSSLLVFFSISLLLIGTLEQSHIPFSLFVVCVLTLLFFLILSVSFSFLVLIRVFSRAITLLVISDT